MDMVADTAAPFSLRDGAHHKADHVETQ